MRSLIIERKLEQQRKGDNPYIEEFKDKVQVGSTIEFNWWSMYGRGSGVKRIIRDIDSEGRPLVKFNGYNNWKIEWTEIEDIWKS